MVRAYDDNGNVVDLVKWEKQIRAEERQAIFDELYSKIMNETEEDIIEWCQDNIIDDVDDYIEKGGKDTNVTTCTYCILDGTDACNRGAGRAVDDEICERFMKGDTE